MTENSCRDRVGCKVRGSRVTTVISGRDKVDCLQGQFWVVTWVLCRDRGDFSLRLRYAATRLFLL